MTTPNRTYLIDSTPAHVNRREGATYLAERAVDDEVAAARGYRFLSMGSFDEEITKKVGIPTKYFTDGGGAVVGIPLFALDAEGTPNLTQVRVLSPDELPGALAGRRFLLPRGATRGDAMHHVPADVNPHPTNVAWVRDVTVPLLITEGAPKGDSVLSAALREEFAVGVVTFTGVDMPVRSGKNGQPDALDPRTIGSPAWRPLIEHRRVVLAFDADMWTKPQVASALRKLAILLAESGADVVVPTLDPAGPKGIDDYLAWATERGERKPLSKLLRSARRFDLVERDLIRRQVLHARPKPHPLADIDLSEARWRWLEDLGATDDEIDKIDYALDLAGNSILRARSEDAERVLGGWVKYPEELILRLTCNGDEFEANRIVSALSTSKLDRFERGELLGRLDADGIRATLGIGESVDLSVVDVGATLEHAIREIRGGRAEGFSFPLGRDGASEWTAEVSARESNHGLWETTYGSDGVPRGRKRILPYVPAQGGELYYRKVDFESRSVRDDENTGFSVRVILPGGHVRMARGVPVAATMRAEPCVTALRKAGVRVQAPVGYDEKEVFERALNLVGFNEVPSGSMYSRLGFVFEEPTASKSESNRLPVVYATLSGGIDADGIRDDVIASNKADIRRRGQGLSDFTRRIAFPELPTVEDILAFPETLLAYLNVAPPAITAPIAGQVLGSICPRGRMNPSVYVYGASGSRKSSIVSALVSGFVDHRGVREEHRSASIIADSSAAVADLGAFAGSAPFVVDDLVETTDKIQMLSQAKVVDDAITAAFEGTSAGRSEQDGRVRENHPHVESPIFTAETREYVAGSRQTRSVMVSVRPGDVDVSALDEWRGRYLAGGLLNRIIAGAIRQACIALGTPDYERILGVDFSDGDAAVRRRLKWGDSREEYVVSRVLAGVDLFLQLLLRELVLLGATEDQLDEFEGGFRRALDVLDDEAAPAVLAGQRIVGSAEDPALRFLDHVAEMIADGRAFLTDATGDSPRGADRYGYRKQRFRNDPATWAPRSGAREAGRLSYEGGDLIFIHTGFANRVREELLPGVQPAAFRDMLDAHMPEEFRGKRMVAGILRQDGGKRAFAARGYVFPVELLGLEPEGMEAPYMPEDD